MLKDYEVKAVEDRLVGWELVEFLNIPIEDVLVAAAEYDWIDEDNYEDLLEFINLRK